MKFLVAMCLLAAGVSAQYGPAGHVAPDGTLTQFTREEAENIDSIGESGVTFKDGTHKQFTLEEAFFYAGLPLARKKRAHGAVVGPAGLITPGGKLIQLPPGVSVVSAGPSAALLSTGVGIQYDRKKRAAPAKSKATVGDAGIITPGNKLIQLPHGVHIVLEGPSAAILSNGDVVQYEF